MRAACCEVIDVKYNPEYQAKVIESVIGPAVFYDKKNIKKE